MLIRYWRRIDDLEASSKNVDDAIKDKAFMSKVLYSKDWDFCSWLRQFGGKPDPLQAVKHKAWQGSLV